jgi:hypothetical protein
MVNRSTRPLPGRSAPRLLAASRQERRCREAVVLRQLRSPTAKR